MKTLSTFLFLALLFTTSAVVAHGDHDHGPITEAEAISLALKVSVDLSSRDAGLGFGKLPESWAAVAAENVSIYKRDKGYYIVSVVNNSEKKTLYVLMSASGDVYDANFTAKFKGIE